MQRTAIEVGSKYWEENAIFQAIETVDFMPVCCEGRNQNKKQLVGEDSLICGV